MEDKKIQIEILPDGTISLDMQCYKGTECDDVLKKIASKIGKLTSNKKKSEYYENENKVKINEE